MTNCNKHEWMDTAPDAKPCPMCEIEKISKPTQSETPRTDAFDKELETEMRNRIARGEDISSVIGDAVGKMYDRALELERENQRLREQIKAHCLEWAEAHTDIQNLTRRVAPEFDVEGDSFGVPCILDMSAEIWNRFIAVEKDRDQWKAKHTAAMTCAQELAKAAKEFANDPYRATSMKSANKMTESLAEFDKLNQNA